MSVHVFSIFNLAFLYLSRKTPLAADALATIWQLKATGAAFFQKENINTPDLKGGLLITLMSSFAEEESRSISENVAWAVRHRFSQGTYTMPLGQFLGYTHSTSGGIAAVEDEAQIVRYLF